jgi:2'-5' RNA ligase
MKVAFWLMLAEPDRTVYQELIDRLAEQYNAPTFAPHVTIYLDEYQPEIDIPCLTRFATEGITSFSMEIDCITHSEQYTKTLFVQLRSHPNLTRLYENLRSQFRADYVLNPHISLIYGGMVRSQQESLAAQLTLANRSVLFDAVSVIVAPDQTENRQDVESWRINHTHKLG